MDDQASLQQQVFDVSDDQPPLEWPLPNGPQQVSPQNNNKRKDRPNDRPRGERTVYVSGLPLDVTKQELLSFMAKCGIIKKDTETGEFKIKLYQDEMGRPKGDALVVYYKPESVDLALLILDESEIRPDVKVKVTKAKFEQKPEQKQTTGASNQKKEKVTVVGKKKKKKPKINQEEELSWVDWETRRHVIIKNMFSPEEAVDDPDFYPELKNDLREEAQKFGDVEVVTVFERNPEGVVAIKFVEPEAAIKCLEVMNGRFFAQRQLVAEWYDGITDYRVRENEEEQKSRLDAFGDWLENQSSDSEEEEEGRP